jgi:glycosyltransferase involved in cell wall biosynthesis
MRIAQVAPPFETVPPTAYGRTERVVSTLTEALVRNGHDVTLFAAGDSLTSARLVPTVDRALWHADPALHDHNPFWTLTLDRVWQRAAEFDVIHSHLDYWGYALARHSGLSVVTTLHGRFDRPELQPLYRRFDDVPLVSISDAQRRPIPWVNWVATVHHGIELQEYSFNPKPGRYLAFLGRTSPEKGLDTAIRVAQRSGMPLRIAARKPLRGRGDPSVGRDWEHYHQDVLPLLELDHTTFIGEVAGAAKDRFLWNNLNGQPEFPPLFRSIRSSNCCALRPPAPPDRTPTVSTDAMPRVVEHRLALRQRADHAWPVVDGDDGQVTERSADCQLGTLCGV